MPRRQSRAAYVGGTAAATDAHCTGQVPKCPRKFRVGVCKVYTVYRHMKGICMVYTWYIPDIYYFINSLYQVYAWYIIFTDVHIEPFTSQ